MLRGILIASLCATLVGCGATIEPGTAPDPAPKALPIAQDNDPVASFKRVVENGIKRLEEAHEKVVKSPADSNPATWRKYRSRVVEPSYDVKKTDSMVSPYVAKLLLKTRTTATKELNSKSAAETSNDFSGIDALEDLYDFDYAFQDGKWVLKSARLQFGGLSGTWHDALGTNDAGYFKP